MSTITTVDVKLMRELLVHFENHVTAMNDDDELVFHKFEYDFVPTSFSIEFNGKFLATYKNLAPALKFFNKKAEEHKIDLNFLFEEFQRERERKCKICGCTEEDCRGCIERTGEPCYWVDEELCSACCQ